KMKQEAESHAADDSAQRELIEAKNIASSVLYAADKGVREHGDKVAPEVKQEIEEKTAELKKVLEHGSLEEVKQTTDALSQAVSKIGEQVQQQQAEASTKGAETDAEEGEYKEQQ
ncbi:MAG: Hsp70 family protein, partial [archaeon]|nr:Hsp70 family protein [archaeon]